MQKKTIVFLYNVRHAYPDANDPRTQLETDFDDPPVIKLIIKHIKKCGYNLIPIEANEKAYLKLYKNREKIDLAFNFSEGIYGNDRECHLPAILEMLRLRYTGSSPLTQALVLNKAKAKEILVANNVSVLPFQVFKNIKEKTKINIPFPIIVKPLSQGSGAGITNKSVVYDETGLFKQVKFIINTFKQPAMIEHFLTGREFSVAMIGNPPRILPIIEPDHSLLPKEYLPLDSLEVKWVFEEQSEKNHLICPAKTDEKLYEKIKNISMDTWRSLEIKDWCRIDLRCDSNDTLYILEINSPAGLLPPEISMTSYFPLAARVAGIAYDELLKLIIDTAFKRYENI
ncbi:MAG: D-alanine--D-alanine ligase [bacterium]